MLINEKRVETFGVTKKNQKKKKDLPFTFITHVYLRVVDMILSQFFSDRITIHDFITILFMLAFKTVLQVANFTT